MNERNRLVIVVEYDCGPDKERALVEAIMQIRAGGKLLNKSHVKIMHVYAAVSNTAKQIVAIFDSEQDKGEKMDMQLKARIIVTDYVNERLEKTDKVILLIEDVYVVWFSKTLQNWKALISTNLPDGMYYEITYNGEIGETYLDAYKKFDNVCVPDQAD
jgi:hypothetical protein